MRDRETQQLIDPSAPSSAAMRPPQQRGGESCCSSCTDVLASWYLSSFTTEEEPRNRDDQESYQAPPLTAPPNNNVAMRTYDDTCQESRESELNTLLPKLASSSSAASLRQGGKEETSRPAGAASGSQGVAMTSTASPRSMHLTELPFVGQAAVTASPPSVSSAAMRAASQLTSDSQRSIKTSSVGGLSAEAGKQRRAASLLGQDAKQPAGHRRATSLSSQDQQQQLPPQLLQGGGAKVSLGERRNGSHVSLHAKGSSAGSAAEMTKPVAPGAAAGSILVPQEEDDDFCPTCLEVYTTDNPKIWTECGHHFHLPCIWDWMERKDTCPMCESPMRFLDLE